MILRPKFLSCASKKGETKITIYWITRCYKSSTSPCTIVCIGASTKLHKCEANETARIKSCVGGTVKSRNAESVRHIIKKIIVCSIEPINLELRFIINIFVICEGSFIDPYYCRCKPIHTNLRAFTSLYSDSLRIYSIKVS